jgi:hypothetical protein
VGFNNKTGLLVLEAVGCFHNNTGEDRE